MPHPVVPGRVLVGAVAGLAALTLAAPIGAQRTGQVTRPVGAPATRPAPLPAPVNVRVEQTPEGQVRVSWDAVPGAKQYFIGRAVGKNGFQRIPGSPVSVPSYLDRAVQPGLRHVYLISAVDSAGIAGARVRSDSIVPTAPRTEGGGAAGPEAPRSVVARLVGATEIEVDWSRAAPIPTPRYEITHRLNDGPPRLLATQAGGPFRLPGAQPGRHQFFVRNLAAGQRASTAASNVVEVPPSAAKGDTTSTGTGGTGAGASSTAPLAAPTGLRVQQNGAGEIVFSWDPVAGAKQYNVKRTIGLAQQGGPGSASGAGRGGDTWTTTTTTTSVVDKFVRTGERYVYVVAAVDSADRAGARATATEFRPADPAGFNRPPAPALVEARATGDDAVRVMWRMDRGAAGKPDDPRAIARFEVAHIENDGPPRVVGVQEREPADVRGLRAGRHQFLVTTIVENRRSDPARTNVVVLPRAGAADTTDRAAAPPDAQVVVTKGEPVVLRVGATYSLAALGQAGWTSLATGVATVSGTAVVTARAAGDTQLVRVAPDAGNVVRVTVVSVRVTP